jgi:hypothetical protein
MAAVTVPPLGRRLAPALLGGFELVLEPQRASFLLGGRERWALEARRFAGEPLLLVERGDSLTRLRLVGARYPGTSLPADLVCELRREVRGWAMRIRFALGGAVVEAPVDNWLAGGQPATGRARLSESTLLPGSRAELRLTGPAEAQFYPSGELRLHGPDLAALSLYGQALTSDAITISLPADRGGSLLDRPPARRTVLSVPRGRRDWPLTSAVSAATGARLTCPPDAFDSLTVETGEVAGISRAALVAAGESDQTRIAYLAGPPASGASGGEFTLPLRHPRFAVAFDPDGDQAALVAGYAPEPTWLHLDGCSLKLGDEPGTPAFEAVGRGGRPSRLICEPALLGMAAPLAGALTEPAAAAPQTRVRLAAATGILIPRGPILLPAPKPAPAPTPTPAPAPTPAPPPTLGPTRQIPPATTIQPRPEIAGAALDLLPFTLPVVRHDDLLALTFRFRNLSLVTAAGQAPKLTRQKANAPAYIIVEFPPQNIAEQAFFETDPAYKVQNEYHPQGTPDDKDAGSGDDPLVAPPIPARMSRPSRLVFSVPADMKEVPYTLVSLLDWDKFDAVLSPLALPPPIPKRYTIQRGAGGVSVLPSAAVSKLNRGGQRPRSVQPPTRGASAAPLSASTASLVPVGAGVTMKPELLDAAALSRLVASFKIVPIPDDQTAIESPYRLLLSPNSLGAWLHAALPVTKANRTELWHTRLAVRASDGNLHDLGWEYARTGQTWHVVNYTPGEDAYGFLRTLRAIWSPDYAPAAPIHDNLPFRMSLDRHDRSEIVTLTADFTIPECQSRTIAAQRLMLSALGAWMDTRYGAELPLGKGLSVEEWRHQATMGRDNYVKVVYKGYLFPFGHRAALVKVTERKFERLGNSIIAYLRQRMYIVVREPEKSYPALGEPHEGRAMPLRKVRITSLVTPNLNKPEDSPILPNNYSAQAAFWPLVGGQPYLFHMIGEDWDGQRQEFTLPLIFVGVENVPNTTNGVAFDSASTQFIVNAYLQDATLDRRRTDLAGQKLAFAESSGNKPGDTTLEATALVWGAELNDTPIDALELEKNSQPRFYPKVAQAEVRLPAVAQTTGSSGTAKIVISPTYVEKAWDGVANKGELFAELADKLPLQFAANQSGGLAVPNLDISGLSRSFGPIGGAASSLATGTFDPTAFFSDSAKIFGAIPLSAIISAIFGADQIPKLTTETERDANGVPTAITTRLSWKPAVQPWPATGAPIFDTAGGTGLELSAELRADLTGGSSTSKITGKLSGFGLNLVPLGDINYFIRVGIKNISFVTEGSNKTDFTLEMGEFKFGGPLSFINTLADIIPMNGFSDPPALDITPSGVKLGYSLALPTLAVGVFSMQNMSLGAGLNLPFLGDALTFRFNFCERQNPFLITVSMFGGGGFFALELGVDGVRSIEASFEFGGNFSLDIGVASGGIYLMAGIYFKLTGSEVQLTGYVRCGGAVNVLGIITISIEFYLGLTYESAGNRCWGQASLTVEIEILFFSVSATLSVEREFAGSSSSAQLDGARLVELPAGEMLALSDSSSNLFAPTRPPSFKDLMAPEDWKVYCEAFA